MIRPVSTSRTECDVLVVGLGSVGAALAALLTSKGFDVLAVDRKRVIYPLPRAVGSDGDIMRIFQGMGLADAIQSRVRFSPCYDFVAADVTLLLRYDRSSGWHPSGWRHNVTFYSDASARKIRLLWRLKRWGSPNRSGARSFRLQRNQ